MKKTLNLILTIAFLFQSAITSYAFTDVSSSNTYYGEIKYLEDSGFLPTEFGDKFNPESEITLEEFYAMLLSFAQVEIDKTTETTDKYAPYINKAIELKLFKKPTSESADFGKKPMRKREVIMKLFDCLGVGVNKFIDKENFPFTDLKSDGAYSPYALKAYDIGIEDQSNPKLAKASKKMTKAEIADILYKIDQFLNGQNNQGNITITIQDNEDERDIDNNTYEVFLSIWDTIKKNYYYKDEIDEKKMLYGAIKGMIGTLKDTYTNFTTPDETSSIAILDSEYEGVGMSVEMIDNKATIITPFKDSPAEKAGLKPGDVITKIDGVSVENRSLDEVVNMIKGPSGTKVSITIERNSSTIVFSITRGYIFYKTVTLEYIEKNGKYIAYINMLTFGEATYDEFLEVAQEISAKQAKDKNVSGIILDLRNNPGGYLDTAIDITGLFFKDNKVAVVLKNKDNKESKYTAKGLGLLADLETVVLINEGSASASEILAGALQDYKKAKLIGTTSFGKGSVQELSVYNDGSIFKLTISKWFTPLMQDINHKGLTPDKVVKNSETTTVDNQLEEAKKEF